MRTICTFLLILLITPAVLTSTGSRAAPPPLSLDQYRSALAKMLAAVQAAQSGSYIELGNARRAVNDVRQVEVTLPDGSTMEADNTWLAVELNVTQPKYDRIEQRLQRLLDELDHVAAPPKVQDPDKAQALLARVLERSQFRRERSLADVFLERLLDALAGMLSRSGPGGINFFVIIMGTLMAIAIGSVVLFVMRNTLRHLNPSAREAGFSSEEAGLTAQQAWKRAEELARTGDRRTAVRYLYLSALLYMDEKDLLVFDRSMTNREYLRVVAGNERLSSLLGPVVAVFDRVWYGGILPDDAEYEEYSALVRRIKELAPA